MSTTTASQTTASPAGPTVDGNNFGNNAFTNFAPLLTLFGDEITKQFLSTSMGWADDVLLGVAPIGIMTIIVCAIRIGGNRFLRSLIGSVNYLKCRARDSPDDEEKEILPSTSANVREIWDGNRIIRQTGESKITEFVFDSKYGRYEDDGVVDWTPDITSSVGGPPKHEFSKRAPNIILNIEKAIPQPRTVLLFTIFGALIQSMVIIVNALAVYYWHWPRGSSAVASYGYPVWATGTISITLGITMCARVVQNSTSTFLLSPHSSYTTKRIVRLQKRIDTLNIPAFAINNKESYPCVWVSIRNEDIRSHRLTQVVVGTTLTVGGFLCQNIGTRELHWSAGVLQLGATMFLTILRAWLRGHVGDEP
ncbi:hypothetical protein F5882DRAFT_308120, partial [Hyaloscypha sp. PMI_1271]